MSLTITSTKSFSGTAGNYSLTEEFSGSALSSASETINGSATVDIEVFANNASTELVFLAIKSDKAGSFDPLDSTGNSLGVSIPLQPNVSKVLFGTALSGEDFYGQGDIAEIRVVNSDSTQATVSIDMLYDATP